MRDRIIDIEESDTWEIQLTIAINFTSSKDVEEERVMHPKSNNIKLTSYNDANEVVDELLKSLCSRCQGSLETSMDGKEFIFDSFELITNVIK